jgi:tRNA pseudouridine55 synthase
LAACRGLTGEILQLPPAFSARHVSGKRLYEWARQGVTVAGPPARVTVYALDVLEVREEEIELDVRCSPGTYVRALARDLGQALGCGAHLAALRRTRSGGFGLEDSVAWDEIGEGCLSRIRPLDGLLPELPSVSLTREGRDIVRHGGTVCRRHVAGAFPDPTVARVRLLDSDGRLLALGVPWTEEGGLRPDVVLMG